MKRCSRSWGVVTITVGLVMLMARPVRAATDAEINQAIEDGLAWLAGQQNSNGSFGSGANPVAYTGVAVLAFENEGHFPGGGQAYSAVVEDGLDFIFQYARTMAIGPQPAGDPDSDGDGIGVAFWDEGRNREVYETGIVMQSIVASNTPDRVVTTGPLAGQTYYDVMVDLVDWAAFGQVDSGTGRGGWRYYANYGNSDNSTAQWPVLGLVAAEKWGIEAPQWVKDKLNIWIDYVQNDSSGGSGYHDPYTYVNISKTGGLLVEMYYVGDDQDTARAQAALGFMDSRWGVSPNNTWYGNKGHSYAMFSVFKGVELMDVSTIPSAPANDETEAGDWWGDYAEYLVNTQRTDGGWNGYSYWNQWMSTGWYIVILQATVFPVSVEVQVSSCECDNTGYDVEVGYSVERFEANGELALYQDDVLVETVPVVDFQGSDTYVYAAPAGDEPGAHTWKAVLSVTGGGTSVTVEDSAEVFICEAPVLDGIPDQTSPFEVIDLLSYVSAAPDAWSYSAPEGWEVTIVDNMATVTAPEGATDPVEITFTAASECCDELWCEDSDVAVFTPMIPVAMDVKPTSCPNPVLTKGGGVLPVAILGTADFDVLDVDPSTVTLEGVPALRWEVEDVATPYSEPFSEEPDCLECTTDGADGFADLTLKFDKKEVVEALGEVADGDCLLVTLSGNVYYGTPIEGMDVIRILDK